MGFSELTVTIDGAMSTGLLAVAFDLLSTTFVTSSGDSTTLLQGSVWFDVGLVLRIWRRRIWVLLVVRGGIVWRQWGGGVVGRVQGLGGSDVVALHGCRPLGVSS